MVTTARDLLFRVVILNAACFCGLSAQTPNPEASAHPFGLDMGMTKAQLSRISSLTPSDASPLAFTMARVPRPHPSIESYVVFVSETVGLCKVVGIGNTIQSSSFGTQLHSEFDDLEKALAGKYGKHQTYDFLQNGSMWEEPNYWMMALYQKERTLAAFWSNEEDASLPSNLQAVMLSTKALSTSEGYVSLAYEFTNFASCKSEFEQKRDSGL